MQGLHRDIIRKPLNINISSNLQPATMRYAYALA
jgi:hypothetical protein